MPILFGISAEHVNLGVFVMSDVLNKINEECVNYVIGKLQDADLSGVQPSNALINVATSILGNLILAFVSDDISAEERHKASKVFLQAVGNSVQTNLDRLLLGKSDE